MKLDKRKNVGPIREELDDFFDDPDDLEDEEGVTKIFALILQHRKAVLFLTIEIVFLLMVSLLWFGGNRQKKLESQIKQQGEQITRQNELIEALKDKKKVEDSKETNVIITSDTLEEQLSSIQELVTQQYIYTNADKKQSSEKWLWGIERPFSGKSIIVTYDGTIKAGVDLSQAKVDIDENNKTITITLPPSKITDNTIPQDRIEIVEAKDGIFNKVTLDDYNAFIAEQRLVMERKAINQGLLTKADEEARSLVKSILSSLPGIGSGEGEYKLEIK